MRRKYLAQRGNSKGPMNTLPISQNTSSYIKKRLQCCVPIVQNVQDRTAGEKIEFIKTRTLQCATENGTNPSLHGKDCASVPIGANGKKCPIVVAKNPGVAVDQSQHIENQKAAENCGDGTFWGNAPVNNAC